MNQLRQPPWINGPAEILKHGLKLLLEDSDVNRRLSMISIDNSVELMIKTYLGLPKRITKLTISRKDYQEFSNNFNDLLDALEKYDNDKLVGINLGEIEWYHRLRNELYHQGNGLTIEKDKVEVYAELAKLLFKNLFGFYLIETHTKYSEFLGDFMEAWLLLEESLFSIAQDHSATGFHKKSVIEVLKYLYHGGLIPKEEYRKIEYYRKLRNDIVHGIIDYKDVLTQKVIKEIKDLADLFKDEE